MDLRTGAAYWPLKSGLISVYPALEHDETCDVAVLGAGITGALAASRLAAAGCDVVVLDGNDVAMGSTAGSTGLLQYETDTSLGQLISYIGAEQAVLSWKAGLRAVDEIEQLCGSCCDFKRRPSLYLASARRRCQEAAARVPSFEPATGLTSRGWSDRRSPGDTASNATARY